MAPRSSQIALIIVYFLFYHKCDSMLLKGKNAKSYAVVQLQLFENWTWAPINFAFIQAFEEYL